MLKPLTSLRLTDHDAAAPMLSGSSGAVSPPSALMGPAGADQGAREYALLQRLADREPAAMEELYHIYSGPLYSAALRFLHDPDDARETLQDVFVKVWEKAPRYDRTAAKPFTWCFMLLRGLCLDRLRRRSVRRTHLRVTIDDVPETHLSEPSHIENLFFREATARVRQALRLLPEHERACVELAVFGDVTHDEIAGRLREPLGTIKSRIRRGLSRLRDLLRHSA